MFRLVAILVWLAIYIPVAVLGFVFKRVQTFLRDSDKARVRLVLTCVCTAALGSGALAFGVTRPSDPIIPEPEGVLEATATEPRATLDEKQLVKALSDATFSAEIDIRSLRGVLQDLTRREQDNQLLDWAVIGTVSRLGISDSAVSTALRLTPPVRLPYLEQSLAFEFGSGRHSNVGDYGLIFYDRSSAHPSSVVGSAADALRVELGKKAKAFYLFSVQPQPLDGVVHVRLERRASPDDIYGRAYGYHEAKVYNRASLAAFLGSVDDLVYARKADGLALLGGRRYEPRRQNLSAEDVGVLAFANQELAEKRASVESESQRIYEEINAEYAAEQRRADLGGGPTEVLSNRPFQLQLAAQPNGTGALPSLIYAPDSDLRPVALGQEHYQRKYAERVRALGLPPEAPGFSLDPTWRTPDLERSLGVFSQNLCGLSPEAARAAQRASTDSRPDFLATSAKSYLQAARSRACVFATRQYAEAFRDMRDAVSSSTNGSARQVEETMGKYFDLAVAAQHDVANRSLALRAMSGDRDALVALVTSGIAAPALEFFRAYNQVQCARYDGPLQGTNVGMTLFYTDLVAKLWQSIDYAGSAPIAEVPGFLSSPHISLDPYWAAELASKPATRLWFGPRLDALSGGKEEIFAASIATRVFAKGSMGDSSKEESEPNEASRLTIGWWDRNYEAVANHEGKYHVLNQIQKWTLLLAWADGEEFEFASNLDVKRDWRYDNWVHALGNELRFHEPIKLRSAADSPTGTECIDILASYPFHSAGTSFTVTGGVSLGSKRTLAKASGLFKAGPGTLKDLERAVPTKIAKNEVASAIGSLRAGAVELSGANLGRQISVVSSSAAGGSGLTLRSGNTVFGRLNTTVAGQKVNLRWHELSQGRAPRLVDEWAHGAKPEQLSLGVGEQIAELPDGTVLIRGNSELLAVGRAEPNAAALAKTGQAGDSVAVRRVDNASSLVDKYEWQRFSLRSSEDGIDTLGGVNASFHGEPPGAGTAIKVDGLGHGAVDVRVVGQEVWISRPPSGWGPLGDRALIDAGRLGQIQRAARGGEPIVSLSSDRGARELVTALVTDNPAELSRVIARADANDLFRTLGDASKQLIAEGDAALVRGQNKVAADLYGLASDRLGVEGREIVVRRALADLGLGDARPMRGLTKNGSPEVPVALRGSNIADRAALLKGPRKISDVDAVEQLVPSPFGEELAVKFERKLDGNFLTPEARRALVEGPESPAGYPVRVYVDDSFNLAKKDLELQGEGLLAGFVQRPDASWQEVTAAGLADLKVSRVVTSDSRSFRELPTRGGLRAHQPNRVVFVRHCLTASDPANDNAEAEQSGCF